MHSIKLYMICHYFIYVCQVFLGLKLALGKLAKTLVSHDNERRARTMTTQHLSETTKVIACRHNQTSILDSTYTELKILCLFYILSPCRHCCCNWKNKDQPCYQNIYYYTLIIWSLQIVIFVSALIMQYLWYIPCRWSVKTLSSQKK